ncbi:MAG: DUF1697 domain-containing protein, partial [Acidimicrobiia bacterium]
REVSTYLQSGNVILGSSLRQPARVGASIETTLRREFDLDIDVAVRTGSQLSRAAKTRPLAGARVDPKTLHVAFLKAKPSASAARRVAKLDFGRDEFMLRGSEIFLRYPNGLGRSKMSNAAFERVLGIPVTIRSLRVVAELNRRAAAAG